MGESRRDIADLPDRPRHPDEIGWDSDDAPELDDAWFEKADHFIGDRLVARGHRPGETERLVLPTDMIERFRSGGPDWQIRIENALRQWMLEHPELL